MTTLRVQSVLFRAEPAAVLRAREALRVAALVAAERGLLTLPVQLAYGDCAPSGPLSLRSDDVLEVHYTDFGANLGPSAGHNRLSADALFDVLFLLGPDILAAPDALALLLEALDDRRTAIVEARQLPFDSENEFDRTTGMRSWGTGACLMIRGEAWRAVRGYDAEHFFLYCNDVDLSWRIRTAGWSCLYQPAAAVFHDKRPDGDLVLAATDFVEQHATLGRLMLLSAWGGEEQLELTLDYCDREGRPGERRGAAEFRARRDAGRLPAARDAALVAHDLRLPRYSASRF